MIRPTGRPSNQSRMGMMDSCCSKSLTDVLNHYDRRRVSSIRYHSRLLRLPPSMAARLADSAPASMDATSQSENVAADLCATSAATPTADAKPEVAPPRRWVNAPPSKAAHR